MKQYVFLGTGTCDRGGLYVGIDVYSKERTIKDIQKGIYSGTLRYAVVDGKGAQRLNQMSLVEFDKVFGADLFTPEQIEQNFRLEIRMKYGLAGIKKRTKRISKKDLEIGRVYKQENGDYVIYLGRVKGYQDKEPSYYNDNISKKHFTGFGYYRIFESDIKKFSKKTFEEVYDAGYKWNFETTKTLRKFIEATDTIIPVPKKLVRSEEKRTHRGYSGYTPYTLETCIEFLEILKGE